MAFDLPQTEIVMEISEEQQKKILKDHFYLAYEVFAENRFVLNAGLETVDGIDRVLTGIPYPFLNIIMGCPRGDWEKAISAQKEYFNAAKTPFAWLIDEGENVEFENKLKESGFQTIGVFRGVIGFLDQPIPTPVLPEYCTIEAVETEAAIEEYNDLLAATFGFDNKTKELMKVAC